MFQQVCQYYKIDESKLTPEAKHELIPKEIRHARAILYGTQTKIVIYTDVEGKPLWFKFEESGILVPTMITLWKCPYIANGRIIYTPLQVLEAIQGGADLMIPGCFPPYPDLIRGEVVIYVSIPENIPLGAGMVLVDKTATLSRDMKGKAAQTVHTLGDSLVLPYRTELTITPDVSFSYDLPYIVEGSGDSTIDSNTTENVNEQPTTSLENQVSSTDISDATPEPTTTRQEDANVLDIGHNEEDDEDDKIKLSTQEIDEIFKLALIQSIFKSIDDGSRIDLPISGSKMLDGHVLANLPYIGGESHSQLNIKKTSWKKATKFFKAMEKEGLLKTKDSKDDLLIQSLAGLEHPLLQNFEPYRVYKSKASSTASTPKPSSSKSKPTSLVGLELWKPHSSAVLFFDCCAPKFPVQQYYDSDDIKQRLVYYINEKKMVNPKDKRGIVVDDVLARAFGLQKQIIANPNAQFVGRDKIVTLLKHQCTPFHIIYSLADPAIQQYVHDDKVATSDVIRAFKPSKGPIPTVLINTERRGGNKTVTLVSGLEAFDIDPSEFAEALRKVCAGSTSVNNIKQGSELKSVLVQGPQVRAIETALLKRGLKPSWIEIKDKVGGGKKGKK